jgi:serine phosphatase RsbU (regulator of sigma subunit)
LEPGSRPIGILPGSTYTEQTIELGPQDLLLVYSDGITEARNEQGIFFGDDRLAEILPRLRGLPLQPAAQILLTEVERFMGEEPYPDDLSLIILRRLP